MRLIGDIEIHFTDKVIDERWLETLRQKWNKKAILPGISHIDSDSLLLQTILHELVPFVVISKKDKGKLIINAYLERFPYTINGKSGFAAFGLRLVPRAGEIEEINRDVLSNIAINSFSISSGILTSDTGNGSLHLECYFKKPTDENLPEIRPPESYQSNVVLKEEDYID